MGKKTIYIVRHGTTEWIEQGIIHGSSESPLSSYGKQEAALTAAALSNKGISKIYSSPQLRARQSAQAFQDLNPSIPIQEIDGLRELHFGKMEGTPDLLKRTKNKKLLFLLIRPIWFTTRRLTGEKFTLFEKRVLDAWRKILKERETGSIVIFAHAAVINTIMNDIFCLNGNKRTKRSKIDTCSITEVEFNMNEQPKVVRLNDTSHLLDLVQSSHD
jgi:broad specificity phosphatase PhoE